MYNEKALSVSATDVLKRTSIYGENLKIITLSVI